MIKERLKELSKNSYQNEKYVIYPAPSVESLLKESKELSHCVKTYIERYALAETSIYLMREVNNKDKSLITIEVKNNEILQARAKCNADPNMEQQKFLDLWQTKILNKATI